MNSTTPHRHLPVLLPSLAFGLLLLAWEGAVRLGGWNPQVFPGPAQVIVSLWELMADGTLLRHAVASLFRVTAGFYLAILLGLPMGIALGRWKPVNLMLGPVIQFLRP